jgi:D-hydroxyproline dehydrogenase subunit gamma
MFTRLHKTARKTVTIEFAGERIDAVAGDSVAAALTIAGVGYTRTTARHKTPRAPYCMMGACFECLLIIDGEPDQQACMIAVRDGMVVARQTGVGEPVRER